MYTDFKETDALMHKKASFMSDGPAKVKTGSFMFFCVPNRWIDSYDYSDLDEKNDVVSTVILLLNSMIGSGILVQAYVFKESGLINATVVYFFIGLVTYFGVNLLAKAADNRDTFNYSELAFMATGKRGVAIFDFSVLVGNIGALLSYLLIIGTLCVDIVLAVNVNTLPSAVPNIKVVVTLLSYFVITPLCLIRNFGHLSLISYVSVFTIVGTVFVVVLAAIVYSLTDVLDLSAKSDNLTLSSMGGTFTTLGSVVFAFGYSPAMLYAYRAASDSIADLKVFNFVLRTTTLSGVVLCYVAGFAGYYTFRSGTLPNILESYSSSFSWLSVAVKLPFIAHLVLYIPGDFVILRYSLLKLMGLDIVDISDMFYLLLSMGVLAAIALVSCVIQLYASTSTSLAVILELTGGLSGSMLNFVFPALIALRLLPQTKPHVRYQTAALFIVGLAVPILVVLSLFIKYV